MQPVTHNELDCSIENKENEQVRLQTAFPEIQELFGNNDFKDSCSYWILNKVLPPLPYSPVNRPNVVQ